MNLINKDIKGMMSAAEYRSEVVGSTFGFVFLLLMLSLMGWSVVDVADHRPTPTLMTKEQLKLYTAESLARQTALINAEMERRAAQ